MPYDQSKNRYNTASDDTYGGAIYTLTPGATDQLDADGNYYKYVVALTSGDVTVLGYRNLDGDTPVTFTLSAGSIVPLRVRRVTAATATVGGVRV